MKIIFTSVAFRFFNSEVKIGGGEMSNRDLIYSLSGDNSVYIISAYGGGGWAVNRDGVISYEVASLLRKWLPFEPLTVFIAKVFYRAFALYKIKQLKPDILLGGTYSANVIFKYKKKNRNCRTGFFIRAFENLRSSKKWEGGKAIVYGGYGVQIIKEMDFVIVNSQFMRNTCLSYGLKESCLNIIYPGVSIDSHTNKKGKSKKIKMISTSVDKGFDIFSQLSKKFPNYQFEVAGDSSVEGSEKITENLTVYGWLNNPRDFIGDADLFLVPSRVEETFGRVAVEAIQLNVPTLVSNAGGLPETVNNNDLFIVKDTNIDSWIEKLNFFLNTCNEEEINASFSDIKNKSNDYRIENQISAWKEIVKKEYMKGNV